MKTFFFNSSSSIDISSISSIAKNVKQNKTDFQFKLKTKITKTKINADFGQHFGTRQTAIGSAEDRVMRRSTQSTNQKIIDYFVKKWQIFFVSNINSCVKTVANRSVHLYCFAFIIFNTIER
jgi:hypothetical protein